MIKFNGLNYIDWSEIIWFELGEMDLDLTLIMDESPPITIEINTDDDKFLYEAWERSYKK